MAPTKSSSMSDAWTQQQKVPVTLVTAYVGVALLVVIRHGPVLI